MLKRYGLVLVLGLTGNAFAATVFYTPSTSYLQASDSPFASMSFGQFYLNDFESNSLAATPGVTASAGDTSLNSGFSGSIVDSVDADDGSVNGQCAKSPTCISYFSGSGSTGITFTFNAGTLGSLPTCAGVVWTDGSGTVTFSANGPGATLLGTRTNADGGWTPGGGFSDQDVAEDHFFGACDAVGIQSIFISNSSGGIEVDHLQYGLAASQAGVPEPGAGFLLAGGLAGLGLLRYRRKRN